MTYASEFIGRQDLQERLVLLRVVGISVLDPLHVLQSPFNVLFRVHSSRGCNDDVPNQGGSCHQERLPDGLCCRSSWSCYSYEVQIVGINSTFDTITSGQECVETLNERRVATEKCRDTFNDAWGINPAQR